MNGSNINDRNSPLINQIINKSINKQWGKKKKKKQRKAERKKEMQHEFLGLLPSVQQLFETFCCWWKGQIRLKIFHWQLAVSSIIFLSIILLSFYRRSSESRCFTVKAWGMWCMQVLHPVYYLRCSVHLCSWHPPRHDLCEWLDILYQIAN